tara:strand:- start:71 stop:307 length:237 start_codon:yes stop_codon:yes gene_type:complete
MFEKKILNEKKEIATTNITNLDPITIWLLRLSSIIIILLFVGILIGIPIGISLFKSQLENFILIAKDFLRNLSEIYLS